VLPQGLAGLLGMFKKRTKAAGDSQ
jgi:hypothetical protein